MKWLLLQVMRVQGLEVQGLLILFSVIIILQSSHPFQVSFHPRFPLRSIQWNFICNFLASQETDAPIFTTIILIHLENVDGSQKSNVPDIIIKESYGSILSAASIYYAYLLAQYLLHTGCCLGIRPAGIVNLYLPSWLQMVLDRTPLICTTY